MLEKLETKLDKLTETAQQVVVRLTHLETHKEESEKRVQMFWAKDWPELTRTMREILDRQRALENNLSAVNAKVVMFGAIFGFAAGFLAQIVNKLIK